MHTKSEWKWVAQHKMGMHSKATFYITLFISIWCYFLMHVHQNGNQTENSRLQHAYNNFYFCQFFSCTIYMYNHIKNDGTSSRAQCTAHETRLDAMRKKHIFSLYGIQTRWHIPRVRGVPGKEASTSYTLLLFSGAENPIIFR